MDTPEKAARPARRRRTLRPIHLEAIAVEIMPADAGARLWQATQILMQIKARVEAEKQQAEPQPTPNDLQSKPVCEE